MSKLEADERPHPLRRRQRVLGRDDIQRLLAAILPRYRPLLATAIYSGMRISELLGLMWGDIDFATGVVNVRAQLSRAHRGAPARCVPPKTPSAMRGIPLVPQVADVLLATGAPRPSPRPADWVSTTGRGTPLRHRDVQRRALDHAATIAGPRTATGRRCASKTSLDRGSRARGSGTGKQPISSGFRRS